MSRPLGDLVLAARVEAGLTQQSVGRRVGRTREMLAQIEAGSARPSDRLLGELCRQLPLDRDEAFLALAVLRGYHVVAVGKLDDATLAAAAAADPVRTGPVPGRWS